LSQSTRLMEKNKSKKLIIAVIGGRNVTDELLAQAEDAGRLIARAGAILATGGLNGVMEAASRGAHEEGGTVLGILPQDDKSQANQYVDVAVATGLGFARNAIIARTADALVAVGGAYGTLSEIAFALQMGKPVAGVGSWDIEGVIAASDAGEAVSAVLERLR
jgi:uncharacterized protein (TIGR00725 family)